MHLEKAIGIVLSSHSFGEGDIISIILTKEFGKKSFLFKGLKKSRKRSFAPSEVGTLLNLIYYHKENRDIIIVKEFNVDRHVVKIRKNLDKILHLYYLMEIVEKTTGYNDFNLHTFRLLDAALLELENGKEIIKLTSFFLIYYLKFLGILPDFSKCRLCGDMNYGKFSFNIDDLYPVCSNCKDENLVARNVKEFIIYSLKVKFKNMPDDIAEDNDLLDMIFYITLFIESYFSIEIKSKKLIFVKRFPSAPLRER